MGGGEAAEVEEAEEVEAAEVFSADLGDYWLCQIKLFAFLNLLSWQRYGRFKKKSILSILHKHDNFNNDINNNKNNQLNLVVVVRGVVQAILNSSGELQVIFYIYK